MRTRITLIAATCFVGAAFSQQPSQSPAPSPGLKALDVWVGDWTTETDVTTTPLGPGGKFSGKLTVRWILNGFFLEMRVQMNGNGVDLEWIQFNWYDAAAKNYPAQGYTSFGITFSGSATVSDNVWTVAWTQSTGGIQYNCRQATAFAADGMSYTSKTEISTDGKTWTLWNESKGTKVKSAPAESVGANRIFGNPTNLGPLVNSTASHAQDRVPNHRQDRQQEAQRISLQGRAVATASGRTDHPHGDGAGRVD